LRQRIARRASQYILHLREKGRKIKSLRGLSTCRSSGQIALRVRGLYKGVEVKESFEDSGVKAQESTTAVGCSNRYPSSVGSEEGAQSLASGVSAEEERNLN
jgi:hypothetical protein